MFQGFTISTFFVRLLSVFAALMFCGSATAAECWKVVGWNAGSGSPIGDTAIIEPANCSVTPRGYARVSTDTSDHFLYIDRTDIHYTTPNMIFWLDRSATGAYPTFVSDMVAGMPDCPPIAAPSGIWGPNNDLCIGAYEEYHTSTVSGASYYQWEVVGTQFQITTSGPTLQLYGGLFSEGAYTLRVRAVRYCGSSYQQETSESAWEQANLYVIDCDCGRLCD